MQKPQIGYRLLKVILLLAMATFITSCSGVDWFPEGGSSINFSSDFYNGGEPVTREW